METDSIASDSQKKKKARQKKDGFSQASMMGGDDTAVGLSREDVERDATYLHAWLMKTDSKLRDFISATSDGGAFFVANVHVKCACGYVRYRKLGDEATPLGVRVNDFVAAAQGRLCD